MSDRKLVFALGYGGALPPFLLFVVGLLYPSLTSIAESLSKVYGISILSFLGGMQWGLAIRRPVSSLDNGRLLLGVTASLCACALFLLPMRVFVPMLILSLSIVLFFERAVYESPDEPRWYKRMRAHLTILLSLSFVPIFLQSI
mgnify:FL=1